MIRKYFSPGRINLIGEHIDYNGGNVLPCAINLGINCTVKVNDSNIITMHSKTIDNDKVFEIDYTKELEKTNCWTDYMVGVIAVLNKQGFVNKVGFDLEVDSNLPHGSGLSSSASLEVLMCTILNDLNNFNLTDKQIAVFSMEAENSFVGVQCVIMDQFIIANAKKDKALLLNTSTLDYKEVDVNLGDYTILILNSNKKRGLVDSAYNKRIEECLTAKNIIISKYNVDNICDISLEQLEEIRNCFDSTVYKRAYHAVSEQHRVEKSVEALNNSDVVSFANCITESHISLRDNYEVSCAELDFLVDSALKYGALGSRMIGAGFGGCAIAIVKSSELNTFKLNVINDYQNKFELECNIYEIDFNEKCSLVGVVNE